MKHGRTIVSFWGFSLMEDLHGLPASFSGGLIQ
jgi:hypothetical protein